MQVRHTLWAIPLLGMLAFPAVADRYDSDFGHRLEQRLDRQHYRIKQGVRSGELTRKEAKRLRRQQRHIAKLERRFYRDGYLDHHERRALRRKLNAASDRIYRLKHNDRVRYYDVAPRYDRKGYGHKHYDHKHHDYKGYDRHDGGWSLGLTLWDRL
ncbi:MAG: hypothetical protein QNJ91_06495 [Gammaproteobacteria bacterium]|nr:hypothetical protein [Gammaproteobacteria bacterium]